MSFSRTHLSLALTATACVASALAPADAEAAQNGPNLRLSVTRPASTNVYAQGRYTLNVANIGNRDATNVRVVVTLPSSQTSPQVYVMGNLGARSANCSVSGLTMTCLFGTVRRSTNISAYYDIALPVSTTNLAMSAVASSNPVDLDAGNNTANFVPTLSTFSTDIAAAIVDNAGPVTADLDHCTGTGLVSFFQCTLFPSSISSHQHIFNADHTISFAFPGYSGTWSQNALLDQLAFTYVDGAGAQVLSFVGYGVDGTNCFEGITTFSPPSAYNSAYSVCLQ